MISISVLALEFCIKAFIRFMPNSINTEAVDYISIFAFSIAFAIDLSHSKMFKQFSTPLFFGYILRVFLVFWDIYGRNVFPLPNSGADTEGFYNRAVLIMNHYEIADPFANVMGHIFRIVGPSRLYGQFIIILFSVAAIMIMASLLYEFEISDKVKNWVCWMVSMLPNFAILSSVFLRESIVVMFIAVSFYFFYRWILGANSVLFILACLATLCASSFHSGSIAVVVGYVAIMLFYDRQRKEFKFRLMNVIPVIIMIFIFVFLFNNYTSELFGKMQSVDELSDVANNSGSGGSSYAKYVGNSSNPLNMIIFTIPRMLFFIASPMPFQWRGISDIIAFCFSSLFFLCTVWFTIKYFRLGEQKNRTLVIALSIILICTFFVFGWGVQNAGTACRHRDKVTIICGLLLALTIPDNNTKYKGEIQNE